MASATVLWLSTTVFILLALALAAWRYRSAQGAKSFAALQLVSAAWAVTTIVGLRLPRGELRVGVWGVTAGLSLLAIPLWFGFILSYTGREQWVSRRRLGTVSMPLVVGGLLYAFVPTWTPLSGEIAQTTAPAGTVVTSTIGPVGAALGVYVYLVFLVGLGLVIKTILGGSGLFLGQALAFVIGSLTTIVASFLMILGIPTEGYPLTQVALGSQALFWGYAVLGQQFLQVVPAVAKIGQRAVFQNQPDGIFVIDTNGAIVRTNPRAMSYLDVEDAAGEPIDPMLERMGVDSLDELPTRFENDGQWFQTTVSPIRNWQDELVGYTLTVREITRLVTREQRLTVFNRVLRHNVRNDMNLVLGIGGELQGAADETLVNMGETLERTALDLTKISDKALEVDRMLDASVSTEPVVVAETVDELVSSLAAQYPEATIRTSVAPLTVHTNPELFSRVLEEVLENAALHAGPSATVTVDVARVEGDVRIRIADDGPGIPRDEVEPVLSGGETALEHASSLGLWVIYWGTQALGGTVEVATTESGSEVTLVIPDQGER
jgi:signal transduction histidine kinase